MTFSCELPYERAEMDSGCLAPRHAQRLNRLENDCGYNDPWRKPRPMIMVVNNEVRCHEQDTPLHGNSEDEFKFLPVQVVRAGEALNKGYVDLT